MISTILNVEVDLLDRFPVKIRQRDESWDHTPLEDLTTQEIRRAQADTDV
jgi:chorismate mutase